MSIKVDNRILHLAEDIASKYDYPVNLLNIADDEFIQVILDDYGSTCFDGLTWFEPDTNDFYIHLNTNPHKNNNPYTTKGRFTLAHELGHYFIPNHRYALMNGTLKPHGSVSYLSNQFAWKIEREADAFASSLLMPTDSFKDYIRRKPFNFQLISDIAERYKVSKSAATLRFTDIGNTPIMVVYAVEGKIRWVSRSEDFPYWRLRYGSGKGDKVPENTVMGTFFYNNDESDCKQEETVFAGDCFSTKNSEENYQEFIEWCIPYRKGECALSIFWEK